MLAGLHDRGFTDLVAAHVDVWRYPGPENQRPLDLAIQTRMTKQALNYLLGQLEQLGYLTRRNRPQRSTLQARPPHRPRPCCNQSDLRDRPRGRNRMGTTTRTPKVRPATPPAHGAQHNHHADERPGLSEPIRTSGQPPRRRSPLRDAPKGFEAFPCPDRTHDPADARADAKAGPKLKPDPVAQLASCASRTAVDSDVVVNMRPNALLFVRRGHAEPAPQARRAPRFHSARGLARGVAREAVTSGSRSVVCAVVVETADAE